LPDISLSFLFLELARANPLTFSVLERAAGNAAGAGKLRSLALFDSCRLVELLTLAIVVWLLLLLADGLVLGRSPMKPLQFDEPH
jgi:hypothetical protein